MPAERAARNFPPTPNTRKELARFPTAEEELEGEPGREASPYGDVYAVARSYLETPRNARAGQWQDMTDDFIRDAALEARQNGLSGDAAILFIRRRAIDKVAAFAQSFRAVGGEGSGRNEAQRAETYARMERDRAAMRKARIEAKGLPPQAVANIETKAAVEAERILAEEERGARMAGRTVSVDEQRRLYDAAYHQAYIMELERFADRERKPPLDQKTRTTPEYRAGILRRRRDPETGLEVLEEDAVLETTDNLQKGRLWKEIASLERKRKALLSGLDIPPDRALQMELFPDQENQLQDPDYQDAVVRRMEETTETEREYLHRAYLGLRERGELSGNIAHDLALLEHAAAELAGVENRLEERERELAALPGRLPEPTAGSGMREAVTRQEILPPPVEDTEPDDSFIETGIHRPRLTKKTEETTIDLERRALRNQRMLEFLGDPKADRRDGTPSRQEAYAELLEHGWLDGTESVDEIQDLVDRYRRAIAAPQETVGTADASATREYQELREFGALDGSESEEEVEDAVRNYRQKISQPPRREPLPAFRRAAE